MMKIKVMMICVFMLFASACEKNKSSEQPVASESTAVEQMPAAPVEQAAPAVTEPPVVEEAKLPEPQPSVVADVAQPVSGESIYKKSCIACHATGTANAPKLGDKAAWKPRIEKGMNVLLQSAINGMPGTAMMKRGTCLKCSDDDLKAAVEYMVSQSR